MKPLAHYIAAVQTPGFPESDVVLINSADEAIELARQAADLLSRLTGDERLIFLSDLDQLASAAKARANRLVSELDEIRHQIQLASKGREANRSYVASTAFRPPRLATRGPGASD
jgi:ABC-type Na+ transport system ATPase subunit NatA